MAETRPVGSVFFLFDESANDLQKLGLLYGRNTTGYMDYVWDDTEFRLAYLITVRTYGTWLHGDERGAVDRHGKNIYRTPRMWSNKDLKSLMQEAMTGTKFILNAKQRLAVEMEVKDVCHRRGYHLHAGNVRTNHFHVVIAAQVKPDYIITALKANATRRMRESGLIGMDTRVWSRGRSRRYLWKPRDVSNAIDYTLNGQGGELYEDWLGGSE